MRFWHDMFMFMYVNFFREFFLSIPRFTGDFSIWWEIKFSLPFEFSGDKGLSNKNYTYFGNVRKKLAVSKDNIQDRFSNTNFHTPPLFLEYFKSYISIGANWHNLHVLFTFVCFLTNTNITFQAMQKNDKGYEFCIKKSILYIYLCR